jgi:hypothetical protein
MAFLAQKTYNHLGLQSFDYDRTWWRLFPKRVVRTKLDSFLFIHLSSIESLAIKLHKYGRLYIEEQYINGESESEKVGRGGGMVFNGNFNNISVISWRSVLWDKIGKNNRHRTNDTISYRSEHHSYLSKHASTQSHWLSRVLWMNFEIRKYIRMIHKQYINLDISTCWIYSYLFEIRCKNCSLESCPK